MVTAAAALAGQDEQTLVVDLTFPGEADRVPFSRADLMVTGVEHSGLSYEVRLFLNNPSATAATPRTAEQGYAGRDTVFGHGGCYGDEGHCEVPPQTTDPTDLRPAHPLHPSKPTSRSPTRSAGCCPPATTFRPSPSRPYPSPPAAPTADQLRNC